MGYAEPKAREKKKEDVVAKAQEQVAVKRGESIGDREARRLAGAEKRAETRERMGKEIEKLPIFVAMREMNAKTVPVNIAKIKTTTKKAGESTAQKEEKSADQKN